MSRTATERIAKIVMFLKQQDYTGSLLVDDAYGPIAGALPLH
jgi:hypothetical protein